MNLESYTLSDKYLLALDNGTQSVRALLFDLRGELVAKARVPIQPYFSVHPGWAEQEPEYFWEALCRACRLLWQTITIPKEQIAGVALTTQRGTVINVDAQGKPLRPAISWLDRRRTSGLKPLSGLWGLLFKMVRMQRTVAYIQAETEANWIAAQQPDIWARTHKYLLLSGYLSYKLTGRFADSVGSQVAYIPFDYRRLRWAGPRDWRWQIAPIQPEMLPDLVPPGECIGRITPQAAEATGLPVGLPLIAAAADKACEVLGSGSLAPHIACLGYGTTATINTIHPRYVEATPLLPPYPAAVPHAYTLEVQIWRGYWMVEWFKHEFAEREQRAAEQNGVEVEKLLDALVPQAPPGSMGLILQPFWSPGLKQPGPEAKGAIIGFGDLHTRAHVYRAILEGIAYALREGAERMERRARVPITELRVCGGGSQSDSAMQLTADVFGLPAARPHVYEASGLGAAIDAAVGLGLYRDFASAVREMTRVERVFQPDAAAHRLYDSLYHEVYKPLYQRLEPLYQAVQRITGYPEL